jgi:hypothetical protein
MGVEVIVQIGGRDSDFRCNIITPMFNSIAWVAKGGSASNDPGIITMPYVGTFTEEGENLAGYSIA